jgi:restriction system protein
VITSTSPESWRDLQEETARILRECGFSVEVEKVVETARVSVELDVYAEESVDGRRYSIVCECKHWRSRVPQTVIHGFRTVVGDLGANLGLIVASSGFQAGATHAAAYTNLRLVSWEEFQTEFERTWLKRYLEPTVTKRCDPLLTYSEPILPAWFGGLSEAQKGEFLDLKRQHDEFGWLMMSFTSYSRMLRESSFPQLPLRARFASLTQDGSIPDVILDAVGYREFLDAALTHSDAVIAKFRAFRPQAEAPSEHE